jgi:hypothetical protein
MAFWRFLDYITEGHQNPISDWYGTLIPEAQAEFDVLVKTLSETEDWDGPKRKKRKYKQLTKAHVGLTELIFKVNAKNLRPIGILVNVHREFIFLGGCEKHTFWTVPRNAFDEALRLKVKFEQGRGTTREHI